MVHALFNHYALHCISPWFFLRISLYDYMPGFGMGLMTMHPLLRINTGSVTQLSRALWLSVGRQGWDVAFVTMIRVPTRILREKKGWKTEWRGKHTIKTHPQKRFWTPPPTYDTFPPHLFTPCDFFLWRKRAQTRQIPLSEASKSAVGGGTV